MARTLKAFAKGSKISPTIFGSLLRFPAVVCTPGRSPPATRKQIRGFVVGKFLMNLDLPGFVKVPFDQQRPFLPGPHVANAGRKVFNPSHVTETPLRHPLPFLSRVKTASGFRQKPSSSVPWPCYGGQPTSPGAIRWRWIETMLTMSLICPRGVSGSGFGDLKSTAVHLGKTPRL